MHADLESLWQRCQRVAAELNSTVMLIGIPPTLRAEDLSLEHMSSQALKRVFGRSTIKSYRGGAVVRWNWRFTARIACI